MAEANYSAPLKPYAHETITVDATAGGVGFTSTKWATGVNYALVEAYISVEDGGGGEKLRYTIDGTAPTTSVGHLAANADRITISGANALINFKAIRTAGVSLTLHVTYSGL